MKYEFFEILLVGCGKIMGVPKLGHRDNHIKAINHFKNLKISACVDIDFKKAKLLAKELNCQSFSNLNDAIMNNRYDVVVLATPDHQHFQQICQLILSINRPRVIFAEKPVCSKPSELEKLNELINTYNIELLVNHTRRIDPKYQNLEKKIQSKFLGEIVYINAYYYNGWLHNGIHIVDTLLYLFKDIIRWNNSWYAHDSDYFGDTSLNALGSFVKSGASINIAALEERHFQLLEIDLLFSQGRIRLYDFGNKCTIENKVRNDIGENVLQEEEQMFFLNNEISPLTNAYGAILDYLETNDRDIIRFCNFETIKSSMQSLFDIKIGMQHD